MTEVLNVSESSKICTIIFPWGKYSYIRLLIGIAGSPDIFQVKMSEQMGAMEFVYAYIDDLLCFMRVRMDNRLQIFDRNQQSDKVSVPENIMVFHFKKCFLCVLYGPSTKKNFALSKAVFYHIWKTKHHIKILKRGVNGAWGLIEVRIWSSWFVQIGWKSKHLFATPRTLNL